MSIHVVVVATLTLYIVIPTVMFCAGWFIRAGLSMLFIELLPMAWQVAVYPDSDAPGTAFLAMMLTPISVAVVLAGLGRTVYRRLRVA